MVPCPAGLTIVFVAARWQALSEALLLLVFFSLGLGAVLIAIGCFVALGRDFVFKRMGGERRGAVVGWLGIASAMFITFLGAYFIWDSFDKGSREIGQMMVAAGEWLSGG